MILNNDFFSYEFIPPLSVVSTNNDENFSLLLPTHLMREVR